MTTVLKVGQSSPGQTDHELWRPLSIPQQAFLHATESEVLYGGAKGGAKSESLVIDPTRYIGNPNFRALILRAAYDELQELLDRAEKYYPPLGGVWSADRMRYEFPSGAFITFGYCLREEHVKRYQGREWTRIYFDEIGNLPDEKVWDLLLAEIRSPDKTLVTGARASANPGGPGHAWLKRRFVTTCGKRGERIYRWVAPNRFALTRRFIPSRVTDNPIYANDPAYMATLYGMPERKRKQLLDGDWDAGEGLALSQLDERVHFIEPFTPPGGKNPVPNWWDVFGGYDWGYNHNGVFGLYTVTPDGIVVKIDSLYHRQIHLPEIHDAVTLGLVNKYCQRGWKQLKYVDGGHDLWHDIKAREERGPTKAEKLQLYGWPLKKATISRISGLDNFRQYTDWEGTENPDGTLTVTTPPRFVLCDTPANRKGWITLTSMVVDPDNVEDALKVDANDGDGGDDFYDENRYSLMSRPLPARKPKTIRAEEEGVTPGYDYDKRTVKQHESGDDALRRMMGETDHHNLLAGRNVIPKR